MGRAAARAQRSAQLKLVATHAATASIGIASHPEGVETAKDILEKADIALYKSKQSGRDRVSVYRKDFEVVHALPDSASTVISPPLRSSSAIP